MKKSALLLLTLGLALAGCSKTDIIPDGGSTPSTVTPEDPDLRWSAESATVKLGAQDNVYPTLVSESGLTITYSSSETGIATIAADGTVTPVSVGSTVITASSAATSSFTAASASYTLYVLASDDNRVSAELAWSDASCTVNIDGDAPSYPTLSNPYGVTVVYGSSNTGVADIDADGAVLLNGTGSTVITANFDGDDNYLPAKTSYTLTITSGEDDGAGTFTFSSSGDPSSADDISTTTFTRKITVTYSGSGASVKGDYFGYVSVNGGHVSVNNTGEEFIVYELSGTSTDGSFKLYSQKKQAIVLSGLSLTNPAGAAINNQSGKRTFLVVNGTNSLSDGSSAAYTTSGTEDMKAVLFSEGQLIFSGSGSLTVMASNQQGKAGITSDDYVRFMSSPTVKVISGNKAGHGVRGKDYILMSDGSVDVSVAAAMKKGFSTDSLARFDDGVTTINVTGGSAKDDDGEYSSSAGIKADLLFEMTGGTVTITNSGQGGKGIRVGSSYDASNIVRLGTSYMSGGTLTIKTTGSYYSTGDKNPKGFKLGWAVKGSSSTWGGPGGGGPGGPGGGGGGGSTYTDMTGDFEMRGGVMTVTSNSAEAIEIKKTLTINGGEMCAVSSGDDAINSASTFTVNNGLLCGISSANDALDANGNFYINGGVVYAVGKSTPELAVDANTEGGFKLYVSGGTLFTIGGLESGASLTQSCYSASSWSKNTWYSITDGSKTYAFKTPSSGGSTLVVSGASKPTVKSGVTASGTSIFGGYGYSGASVSGGSTVSLSSYSGGSRW